MLKTIINRLKDKEILILGFGKEGRSSLKFIRHFLKKSRVTLADANPEAFRDLTEEDDIPIQSGEKYLAGLENFDIIIKSPGVIIEDTVRNSLSHTQFTSQTELFLEAFSNRTIGITGTKGKSTTSSLIHHILLKAGKRASLLGNIGIPPLDVLLLEEEQDFYVFEMSSMQLDDSSKAPHIAIILNLYPEHLDRYSDEQQYYFSKWKIAVNQNENDILIYNSDSEFITQQVIKLRRAGSLFPFTSSRKTNTGAYLDHDHLVFNYPGTPKLEMPLIQADALRGVHNQMNTMAAVLAVLAVGISPDKIHESITTFKGLPHRMEYVGCFRDITFYNDSIATIPEATQYALDTIPGVDTLILGGYDRGLKYDQLVDKIIRLNITNLILMGPAGSRMHSLLVKSGFKNNLFFVDQLKDAFRIIPAYTRGGGICLLSPAAASYDQFRDFTERGEYFKKKAEEL